MTSLCGLIGSRICQGHSAVTASIKITVRGDIFSFPLFLPPGNEVCEGNVFTGVFLSTVGGAYVVGGIRGRGVHGRRDGHCSGRYEYYWNAFLFFRFIPYFRVMSSKNMSWTEIPHVRPGSHLYHGCAVPSTNKHFWFPWLYLKVKTRKSIFN